MAVIHSKGKITLTEKEASNFSRKMKRPDISIMRKRDAFIKEARESIKVIHKENGKITLKG